jgi:hypothetical protein
MKWLGRIRRETLPRVRAEAFHAWPASRPAPGLSAVDHGCFFRLPWRSFTA